MADRELVIRIVGDDRDVQKAFGRTSNGAKKLNGDMDKLGRGVIIGSGAFRSFGRSVAFASAPLLGGAGFVAAARHASDAASDLHEEISKTQVVFGQSANAILDWSKTTANAMGLSRREALGVASSFGALFQPLGITGRVAEEQSRQLTQLGADLASFYNTDVSDALDAIRSGIVGESEPLRRYGVLLSESRVQAEALSETHKKTAKDLTGQEKALARINLIFRDSTVAQGDFARTSGGLANQTRILQANLDNLAATIGTKLNPAILHLTQRLNDLFVAMDDKKPRSFFQVIKDNTDLLENVPNVGPLAGAIGTITGALDRQAEAARKASAALREIGAHGTPAGGLPEAASHLRDVTEAAEARARKGITPAQRNTFFDNLIGRREDRVQDIRTLRGQAAELLAIIARIQQEIRRVSDPTRKLTLGDDLVQVQRERRSVLEQIAADAKAAADQAKQDAKDAAERAKELAQAARERALAQRNAAQFGALGLGPTGEQRVPGLRALRTVLGNVAEGIQGTFLDTKKTKSLISGIRRVLSGSLGDVSAEVRSQIQKMLADIDRQLKEHQDKQTSTRFRVANTDAILGGLGLSPDQLRAARARLAQLGAGGTLHGPSGGSAFGFALPPLVLHSRVEINDNVLGRSTVRYQQRRNRRFATQTTGPHAGNATGTVH